MQPGVYTLYHKATGRYLSYTDRSLTLSSKPQSWTLKPTLDGGFHIYAYATDLLLDIHNAQVTAGNRIKLWTYTAYDVQIWKLSKNPNGTYSVCYYGDPGYCLGFLGQQAQLQLRLPGSAMQEWVLTDVSHSMKAEFVSFTGNRRTVTVELAPELAQLVPQYRLQQWANDLETAYETFSELTNFRPFRDITVEAYLPPAYPDYAGWVFPGTDIIHVNRAHFASGLQKLRKHSNDWNFCVLHEMGHMFDTDKPWNFESELMTDLKVAYVLEKNQASAVLAEFNEDEIFHGGEIAEAYRRLSGDLSKEYDIFACTKRFLDIKDHVGWEPFRKTFHMLQKDCSSYIGISPRKKFDLFIGGLSYYSRENIRAWFSDAQWAAILRQLER